LCIIVYLAVQFIENQFIYPHVVGNSVGLPPLFTLLAVMLGGKLLGLLGMIFFIPLMAVVYALVREDLQRRDERKPIPRNSKFSP
jgi:predicted PurR-regulated permease PerM